MFPHACQNMQDKKKKWEPPAPPPRVGKKQRKRDAASGLGSKLPTVTPSAKCKLRLLKLERIKDYLLMEHEFVQHQEQLKPQDERNEEDRSKVQPHVLPRLLTRLLTGGWLSHHHSCTRSSCSSSSAEACHAAQHCAACCRGGDIQENSLAAQQYCPGSCSSITVTSWTAAAASQ
jgi:hypothetical protein